MSAEISGIVGKIIDIALPILLTYIVYILKDEREERKANTQGMKEILGYMIDRWHEEFILQGYVTTDQRNQFEDVYNAYAKNKGNGARKKKWEEVQALHVDDTKSSISPFLQFYFEQKNKMEHKDK